MIKTYMLIFHVEDLIELMYDVILGRDILMELIFGIISHKHDIVCDVGPYNRCTTPMININYCRFNSIINKTVIP